MLCNHVIDFNQEAGEHGDDQAGGGASERFLGDGVPRP
jgi:hypothetical protein